MTDFVDATYVQAFNSTVRRLGGRTMLYSFRKQVQALLDRATDTRQRAGRATFPEDRQFWLDMEIKFLALARRCQEVERTAWSELSQTEGAGDQVG